MTMKIFKMAAGGPPPGHVRVRFTFKTGEPMDVRIVAHGPNTSCQTENDASLLKDLVDAEVPGFGTPEILDTQKTLEGAQPIKPISTPPTKAAPFGEEPGRVYKPPEKKLDMGFGV
jgi:hypothetical protein